MKVTLPRILRVDLTQDGNLIQQLAAPSRTIDASLARYRTPRLVAVLINPSEGSDGQVLLLQKRLSPPPSFSRILLSSTPVATANSVLDVSQGRWLKHPDLPGVGELQTDGGQADEVHNSWTDAFSYVQENVAAGIPGLRPPQLGALHAVYAHWAVSADPATIVMPTGTGKTEVMLSVLVSAPCRRVLVIVPTDALRNQLADKFLTLGILRRDGSRLLSARALYPIVGVLKRRPRSVEEVDRFFTRCNVIVSTSHIAGQASASIQERMAQHCPFLFIDEAHHVEAPTWAALKSRFASAKILQFTATPFREDDKLLDGRIIYRYPLRRAQQEGYFKPIRFRRVDEFNRRKADEAIAAAAVEQLRLDAPRKHILMARVGSIEAAARVAKIYEQYPEFSPLELHTGITSEATRRERRRKLLNGESRIVICVDMLGEGFDLPELKIAAFHDIRKSLAVTLQLAGRFIRARADLGDATFVANVADVDVNEQLRKLYAQDPDWNALLPDLTDTAVSEQISIRDFLDGFATFPVDIPSKSLRPATSAVLYRTHCVAWTPQNFRRGLPGLEGLERVEHAINPTNNTLVIMTLARLPIEWADVRDVYTWDWQLYVLFWDSDRAVLFIHGSSNRGTFRSLARAVAGEDVELIHGQDVFRSFSGVNRLRLTNVGLTEQLGRRVRFTGRMGADVKGGLTDAQKRNTSKTVLFGAGYENGMRVTVGASSKGRIWAFQRVRLDSLVRWFKRIGGKVLDASVDPDEVLTGTLEAKPVTRRPDLMPIAVDWPDEIYQELEKSFQIVIQNNEEWEFHETAIELVDPTVDGPLRFRLRSGESTIRLELVLGGDAGYRFVVLDGRDTWIRRGSSSHLLSDFFDEHPPMVWFVNGASLEGNQFTALKSKYPPYDRTKIEAWDWHGINPRKESQGMTRDRDSIQRHVIEKLGEQGDYSVIFDDDGSGEAADVVAIKIVEEEASRRIEVNLYHCKYAETIGGRRIDDLYEVCGQAQKSIGWMYSPERQTDLCSHFLRREPKRWNDQEMTRFETGDRQLLLQIREMSRVVPIAMHVYVVQPGLSKAGATEAQLELLSVTEHYLSETYNVPFTVIGSA